MKNPVMKSLAIVAAGAFFSGAALAASPAIENAKASCIVGEQADGYLGVVDQSKVDEQLQREVRSVNQQRKAAYASLAERNGVTIEQTALLTAEKLINNAPSGHCVQMPGGSWVKQP